jgi:uncharacterized RDD family membrane protein YckC
MRLSLFEALRIESDASEGYVRASLRRLIRRMYLSTRDSTGDVEEGLRFCNAASAVLLESGERTHYEGEYANMVAGGTDLRRSHAPVDNLATGGDLAGAHDEAPSAANGITSVRPGLIGLLEIVGAAPASIGISWALVGLALLFVTLTLFAGLNLPWQKALQYLILVVGLSTAAAAAGVAVHRGLSKAGQTEVAARLRDVPIVKWRRERSVFMGSRLRNEEAAWVYRLRVAETDRARNIRSSQVSIWMRLAARLVDYGLWGALIYAVITALAWALGLPDLRMLTSWWALPIFTVLTFIPVDAWCLHHFRRTPGKWLLGLRCRPGMTSVNAPDAQRESPRYALLRAAGAAFFGAGAGLPVLSLLTPLSGIRARSSELETRWDAMGDSIITQSPLTAKQAGFGLATLVLLISGYVCAWWPSFVQTGAIMKEARQLAPQVSWGQLLSVNPKSWIPEELLNPKDWRATEKVSAVTSSVTTAATGMATSVLTGKSANDTPEKPAPTSAARAKFEAYATQVNKALDANSPASALQLCTKWVVEEPESALAWKCYGLGLQSQTRHTEALQALRRSQKLNPADLSLNNAIRISFSSLNDRAPPR